MSKGAYIGIDGVARKIKKGFVGVDGVARKIRRAYIGIGGVARPCWSGGELTYYGTISGFPSNTAPQQSTTLNGYGFVSGSKGIGMFAVSPSLTTTSLPDTTANAYYQYPSENGKYAMFCGGRTPTIGSSGTATFYSSADAYDNSFTRTSAPTISSGVYRGARSGNSAVFLEVWRKYGSAKGVTAYDQSLTKIESTDRSWYSTIHSGAGSSAGNYAMFVSYSDSYTSGNWDYSYAKAAAYNKSLTQSLPSRPISSSTRSTGYEEKAGSVGGNAIFMNFEVDNAAVFAYSPSLTLTNLASLPSSAYAPDMVANAGEEQEYLIFAGGYLDSTTQVPVLAYDQSLTLSYPELLSKIRVDGAGVTAGKYAVFLGGNSYSGSNYADAEVYTVV